MRQFDSAHFAEIRQSLATSEVCMSVPFTGACLVSRCSSFYPPIDSASLRLPSSEEQESAEARFSRIATSAPMALRIHHHNDHPRPVDSSSGQFVEKEIDSFNPPVTGNEEIRSGVSRRFPGTTRYPFDAYGIAQFLGLGNWLISKVRVSSLDRARDAIDLVTATVGAAIWDRRTRQLRPRSRRWPRAGARDRFRRRHREDCGSSSSICY